MAAERSITCHTIQGESQTRHYDWWMHTDPSTGEAASSLEFKSLEFSVIEHVNIQCLVGHHTNDITSSIKIAESDWCDKIFSQEQLVVCTLQDHLSLGLGVWLKRLGPSDGRCLSPNSLLTLLFWCFVIAIQTSSKLFNCLCSLILF